MMVKGVPRAVAIVTDPKSTQNAKFGQRTESIMTKKQTENTFIKYLCKNVMTKV